MKQIIKFIFFIFIFWIHPSQADACLNYYHTIDKNGKLHEEVDEHFRGFNKNFNYKLIASKLPKLEADFQESQSPYILSDYAVLLMKAGKVKESLILLIELNKRLPNEYQIAANLGTAYELNGELDSALLYINRGIAINPDAHGGSEWVHIKVLETKLHLIENPDYLNNTSVLQLTTVQKADQSIRYQLEIQIRERFPFSPGPNQIMASLMIDLGDCYAANLSIEYAKAFYNTAEKYYGADKSITGPKVDQMIALRGEYKDVSPPKTGRDGMEIKITGVSYSNIIDDNNSNNYTINWSEMNLDMDALIEHVNYTVQKPTENDEETRQAIAENKSIEETALNTWALIFIFIGIVALAGTIYFFVKK